MTIKEIQSKLLFLNAKGFVSTKRKGPTGIGHTLEQELNLTETNLAIPDIGGRIELKASRKASNSMVTLFTFNRAVWNIDQKEIIEKYGYTDNNGRKSLYSTIFHGINNPQDLQIEVEKSNNKVYLKHQTGVRLATWSIFTIVGKFISKLDKLIIVFADTRINELTNKEEFHYNQAYLLEKPSPDNFLEAFTNSIIAIDVRMHLKENDKVRNHGTGFRIKETQIPSLYGKRRKIM
ncbi:MAG: hypothetical protein JEY97_11295 [Bacteroidales bacterium]|nr:hypothetical protein [Bacteroidales bacterium]